MKDNKMQVNFKGLVQAAIGLTLIFGIGIYFGFWICFINGIALLIDVFKQPETNAFHVLMGLAGITVSSLIIGLGIISGVFVTGHACFETMKKR